MMSADEHRIIRDAASGDAPALAAIYNHYVLNTTASFEESALTAETMAGRVSRIQQGGHPWLVAEDDGDIRGYAYAGRWNERHAYRHTAEVTVYMAPDYRSRGLGSLLYAELFERLRDAGCRVVIGVITLPNAHSVAIHEKFGLRQAGLFAEVGYKFGRWIDVGYWRGQLTQGD
jgi:phosphinothricin acetyltransferase